MAKILIAEDERISSTLLVNIVESMGHVGFVSPNGMHAFETLLVNPGFSLLLTDIMMPQMDGETLIKQLRERGEFNSLPIIVVSAYVGPQGASELLEAGATFIVQKPIIPNQIREYVSRALEMASSFVWKPKDC